MRRSGLEHLIIVIHQIAEPNRREPAESRKFLSLTVENPQPSIVDRSNVGSKKLDDSGAER